MSSATSTDGVSSNARSDQSLRPWQFFVLAALGCATAATFMARGQGVTAVVLISLLMATVALIGLMALRTVQPLVSNEEDRTPVIGQRTRASLEREKSLALRAIKELEFDRAMGRLSDEDWHEMSSRLRARAARLIRQLDAGAGYRDQIEQDLAKRVTKDASTSAAVATVAGRSCAACDAQNDADAKFCKNCGARL